LAHDAYPTLFSEKETGYSGWDLVLFFGGLFLLAKSTVEIHNSVEHTHSEHGSAKVSGYRSALIQIAVLDSFSRSIR
jgi:predicted tellurium resistance membrane protein TerC